MKTKKTQTNPNHILMFDFQSIEDFGTHHPTLTTSKKLKTNNSFEIF